MKKIPRITLILMMGAVFYISACAGNEIQPEDTKRVITSTPQEIDEVETQVPSDVVPTRDKKLMPPVQITPEPPDGWELPKASTYPSQGLLDWESTSIELLESFPVQVRLYLSGNLRNPCHVLHFQVSEPDDENRISVDVYTEIDKDANCIQVITPFSEVIELGTYTEGTYTVYVNGYMIGEFTI